MASSFHLSLPCLSIKSTKEFYENLVGASLGRQAQNWVDVNLFNHQITFTKAGKFEFNSPKYMFEGSILPSFHFGVILSESNWEKVLERLKSKNAQVQVEATFLKDKIGEHNSFFVKDPNGYTVEFKCFASPTSIFDV